MAPDAPRLRRLIGLLAVAGLLIVLVAMIGAMQTNTGRAFDRAILLLLRAPDDPARPLGPSWLAEAMRGVTRLGDPTLLALVASVAVGCLLVLRRVVTASLLAAAIASGFAVEKAMKLGFDRARPEVVPHLVVVRTASFPSGHAMLSAITYLILAVLLIRTTTARAARATALATALLLTGLIGASRVYLGVHWPTDVVAGWSAGAIWAIVFCLLAERIAPHGPRGY